MNELKEEFKYGRKGITLIALVITIIVLLILVAVSIATLTGDNGILTRTSEAREKTEIAEIIEKAKLDISSWISEKLSKGEDASLNNEIIKDILDEKEYVKEIKEESFISTNGEYEIFYSELYTMKKLLSSNETSPYLPSDDCEVIENDLDKGVVVRDENNNEWVWIEVPKSVTKDATTDEEIKNALTNYATDYRGSYSDIWYKECGLGEQEYVDNYNEMLQSIKTNGGFWIGRYEMGLEDNTIRKEETKEQLTGKALSQKNKLPYNFITVSQAQQLAKGMNPNENRNISSIMYGIQWDLVCKFIEEKKAKNQDEIKIDSTNWGNYFNSSFNIINGQYSENLGESFILVNNNYLKAENTSVLLSTGATDRNKILNIYDFAGNEREWTLENSNDINSPSIFRSGGYNRNGNNCPASSRFNEKQTFSSANVCSRPTLFSKSTS